MPTQPPRELVSFLALRDFLSGRLPQAVQPLLLFPKLSTALWIRLEGTGCAQTVNAFWTTTLSDTATFLVQLRPHAIELIIPVKI